MADLMFKCQRLKEGGYTLSASVKHSRRPQDTLSAELRKDDDGWHIADQPGFGHHTKKKDAVAEWNAWAERDFNGASDPEPKPEPVKRTGPPTLAGFSGPPTLSQKNQLLANQYGEGKPSPVVGTKNWLADRHNPFTADHPFIGPLPVGAVSTMPDSPKLLPHGLSYEHNRNASPADYAPEPNTYEPDVLDPAMYWRYKGEVVSGETHDWRLTGIGALDHVFYRFIVPNAEYCTSEGKLDEPWRSVVQTLQEHMPDRPEYWRFGMYAGEPRDAPPTDGEWADTKRRSK